MVKRIFILGTIVLAMVYSHQKNPSRNPATEEQTKYTTDDAIDHLKDMITAQPKVKEVVDNVKKKGEAVIDSLEEVAKEYHLDLPAAVVGVTAKALIDQKIEVGGTTPLWKNKYKIMLKPDEYKISFEGDTFINNMKYGISSGNKHVVDFRVHMDF